MTVKPFKIIMDENESTEKLVEGKVVDETFVRPQTFKPDAKLDTVVETSEMVNDVNEEWQQKKSTWAKINLVLGSFSGILLAVLVFFLLAIIAHTISSLIALIASQSLADYIYLLGLLILLLVLLMNIKSNIQQLYQLKSARKLQVEFGIQKKQATKDIIPLCLLLCKHYEKQTEKQTDKQLQSNIKEVKNNLNSSQIYTEIYKDIDENLLKSLDDKARLAIKNSALQIAFSTAASPVPIIDMFLITWRSYRLTKDIAKIYGFRPGGLTSIILLKQGIVNVIFAGVSELVLDMGNEVVGATVVNHISKATGQGMANGILLARLGHGVLDACRPIKTSANKESIIKVMLQSFVSSSKKIS